MIKLFWEKLSYLGRIVFMVFTILSSVLLIFSYSATWIAPSTIWLISFLGLGCHLLILTNIILMLIWVLIDSKIFIFPLVSLILGLGYYGNYFQPSILKSTTVHKHNSRNITIMSYNVNGFYLDKDGNMLDSIISLIKDGDIDIACFQEFKRLSHQDSLLLNRSLPLLPYRIYGSNLAIISRYSISDYKRISLDNTSHFAISMNIRINSSTVITLYNCHLQTTEFNKVLSEHNLDLSSSSSVGIGNTLVALKSNSLIRHSQVSILDSLIKKDVFPTVLAGDFNDPPTSYTYGRLKGDLKDSFSEAGRGYGYTYNSLGNLFRIDYIFVSPYFNVLSYVSPYYDFSDHNPVISTIQLL